VISESARAEITRLTGNPHALEQWTADHLPDGEQLEQHTRKVIDSHTEWDSMYKLFALSWDGEKLGGGAIFVIDNSIEPARYPHILPSMIAQLLLERSLQPGPPPPLAALSLQVETHTVDRDSLTEADRKLVEERKMHTLPQAVEKCMCLTVDIAGRTWWGTKTRGTDQCEYGDSASGSPYTGGFANLLARIATALPLPYIINEHGCGRLPEAFGGSRP
jgi:hypothetical protein